MRSEQEIKEAFTASRISVTHVPSSIELKHICDVLAWVLGSKTSHNMVEITKGIERFKQVDANKFNELVNRVDEDIKIVDDLELWSN